MQVIKKILFVLLFALAPITIKASPWLDLIGINSESFMETLANNNYKCGIKIPKRSIPIVINLDIDKPKQPNEGFFSGDFDYPILYDDINEITGEKYNKITSHNYDINTYGKAFKSKAIKSIHCKQDGYGNGIVSAYFLNDKIFQLSLRFNLHCFGIKWYCHKELKKVDGKLKDETYGFWISGAITPELFYDNDQSFPNKFGKLFDTIKADFKLMELPYDACSEIKSFKADRIKVHETNLNAGCELNANLNNTIWSSTTVYTIYESNKLNEYNPINKFLDRRDFIDTSARHDAYFTLVNEVEEHFKDLKKKYPSKKLLNLTD